MGRLIPVDDAGTPAIGWVERARRPLAPVVAVGRGALREAAQDRISSSAASLAFHWFLAVFPAAVAAIGLAGVVGLSPSTVQHLLHGIGVLLPVQVSQVLDQALRRPPSGRAGGLGVALGVAVALWSAVEAQASLQVGLDVAFEVHGDRGFIGRRLMALPLVALTVALGGSASVLLVLGDPLRRLLPKSFPLVTPAFDATWELLRFGAAVVLILILLSAYYALGPKRARFRWRWLSVGSATAGAGWVIASVAFATYLDHFGHESRTYGAFAGVAVLALWLYLTAMAVLLGAEIDAEIERRRPGSGTSTAASLTQAAGPSAETTGRPAETTGTPAETTGRPTETTGTPAESTGPSAQAASPSATATSRPAKTTSAPAETTGGPAGPVGAPAQPTGDGPGQRSDRPVPSSQVSSGRPTSAT
jgi:membrane protein